jgi:hypothetical protein
MRRIQVFGLMALGFTGVFLGLQAAQGPDRDIQPSGRGIGTLQHPPMPEQANGNPGAKAGGAAKPSTNGITYHGGPIMTLPVNMYYIWYGNWSGNTATSILADFATNIGSSAYYRINSTYTNGAGQHVSTAFAGATASTTYPYGTSLSDAQIRQVVQDTITSGQLPFDENGVYFVLTSADVTASSGFCTQYCGWHTYSNMTVNSSTKPIKYSFIGNPDRCLSACAAQTTSPNGNAGADGMASIIAHELEEAASDPQLNAWYDSRGYENADKCAWTFGTTYKVANGSSANMKLGLRDFLIQRNWVNANGGYCSLSF